MAQSNNVVAATQPIDDGILVKVVGEIDLIHSPTLRGELMSLLQSRPQRLVLDLSDVSLMDSSGVATLIDRRRLLGQQSPQRGRDCPNRLPGERRVEPEVWVELVVVPCQRFQLDRL